MELLIRTKHKHPAVAAIHEASGQRGDVIAACPDGWAWSDAERTNPDWIIIRAKITQIEADALMESARPDEGKLKRRIGIDLEGLQAGEKLTRIELMARVF